MTILTARGLHKAYGPYAVLEGVDLTIHAEERVGLVGDNGSGKSTLGRILAGWEEPDAGESARRGGARVEYLPQVPQLDPQRTARQEVLAGLAQWTEARQRYEQLSEQLSAAGGPMETLLEAQAYAAADVERLGGWEMSHLAESMLGKLEVADLDARLGTMSGGEQRRVALARVLVAEPDLAVLDEPTNHLDIHTVEWLEQYLLEQFSGALLLITHDRFLLDRVAGRILELDHGALRSYEVRERGAYETFLEAKAERLAHEARVESNRQRFLRQELEWLRRAPKARTGKQKARIHRAEAALDRLPPKKQRKLLLDVDTRRSGKSILELQELGVEQGGHQLVKDLGFVLTRGQRVGIIGPNGCGKTTLLRTITGSHEPSCGRVLLGKNTRATYLSQDRDDLDDELTVMQNVSGDGATVRVGDEGTPLDVHSYLARFLFSPAALRQPVGSLSGGERTRVVLAKLLCHSTNLLILDEPTNDLDVATLSVLEQLLVEFSGTALVVTHDRWFLDRVATALLVFEGDGRVVHHAGNYSTYQGLRAQQQAQSRPPRAARRSSRAKHKKTAPTDGPRPLTYGERLELERIVAQVEEADLAVQQLEARLADPELYKERGAEVPGLTAKLKQARAEAARLMARWEELEARA